MDVEAAGADRLEPGLAHRHPVGLAELFDVPLAGAKRAQRGQVLRRWRVIEIGVDQPVVGPGLVGLVRDQHRRAVAEAREIVHRADRLALRPGAADGGAEAHFFAFSFASRSSSSAVTLAA